jgi:hypothetical protein
MTLNRTSSGWTKAWLFASLSEPLSAPEASGNLGVVRTPDCRQGCWRLEWVARPSVLPRTYPGGGSCVLHSGFLCQEAFPE